jgi:hypothetical protein
MTHNYLFCVVFVLHLRSNYAAQYVFVLHLRSKYAAQYVFVLHLRSEYAAQYVFCSKKSCFKLRMVRRMEYVARTRRENRHDFNGEAWPGRTHSKDLGMGGRMLLKWILRKCK